MICLGEPRAITVVSFWTGQSNHSAGSVDAGAGVPRLEIVNGWPMPPRVRSKRGQSALLLNVAYPARALNLGLPGHATPCMCLDMYLTASMLVDQWLSSTWTATLIFSTCGWSQTGNHQEHPLASSQGHEHQPRARATRLFLLLQTTPLLYAVTLHPKKAYSSVSSCAKIPFSPSGYLKTQPTQKYI